MFRSRDSKDVKASFDFVFPCAVTFATFVSSPNSVTLLGSAILFLLNCTLIPLPRSRISAPISLVTELDSHNPCGTQTTPTLRLSSAELTRLQWLSDTQSLWEIESLRSKLFEVHSLKSGFSCAKGFLLERKPDNAAAMIQVLDQDF
ncbi:hypothetical protein AKJ16_DCAP26134 [Drosera capensis]